MDVPDEWSQNRYTLDDDRTNDLGRVPDVRVCIAPKVPFVLWVAAILPASSDRGNNGDYHSEAHGQTETDLLNFAHIEIVCDKPGKCSHDKVHDDVVY